MCYLEEITHEICNTLGLVDFMSFSLFLSVGSNIFCKHKVQSQCKTPFEISFDTGSVYLYTIKQEGAKECVTFLTQFCYPSSNPTSSIQDP